MTRVLYRCYKPTLFDGDLELLADVDEYYQDVLHRVGELAEPKIFITSWLIHRMTRLNRSTTFQRFIRNQLRKPGGEVRILWNTNYNGFPYPGLLDIASFFHRRVVKAAGVDSGRLQIILSTNLQADLPDLPWQADLLLAWPGRPSLEQQLQEAWMQHPAWKQALESRAAAGYRNLAVATLGAHHQKTLAAIGTKGGKKHLVVYCGGIDFSSGPSGRSGSIFHGGKWWHDTAVRVDGEQGVPVMENFIERWNEEIEDEDNLLAFGLPADPQLDDDLFDGIEAGALNANAVEFPRTMDGETGSLDAYEDWIPEATEHVILINQYVRHPQVTELLVAQLDDELGLQVTIVMPSYTEEMGKRINLVRLRERFAAPGTTATRKAKLLSTAQRLSLTIDPVNKLTLYLRSKALREVISNPRCRVWIPRPMNQSLRIIRSTPYIHAKMMLVDRQAVMVGSANVNGRSLDGDADTEINALITDRLQIDRMFSRHKWHEQPDRQGAAGYASSWYGAHNLVRYTEQHLVIDEAYGLFPSGRDGILRYFDAFRKLGIMEKMGLPQPRARFEQLLDDGLPGIDLDGDIGAQLEEMVENLI